MIIKFFPVLNLCNRYLQLMFYQDAYMKILPLYFPRSSREEVEAIKLLPEDIGNENGEPIIPERQIRIMDKPMLASMSKLQTKNLLKSVCFKKLGIS